MSCYSVEVNGQQAEESREVYQGPELDCSVGALMPGKTYSFRVKAANKAGVRPTPEAHLSVTGAWGVFCTASTSTIYFKNICVRLSSVETVRTAIGAM